MGEGDRAAQSLYAFANHASPLLVWREEHNPRDLPRDFVGDMPHNWASAEFTRLTVHLLALDRGNELHLFEGMPKEWLQPNMVTALKDLATPFGKLTFSLEIDGTGKLASLKIEPLTDSSCKKVVVHLRNMKGTNKNEVIELNPKEAHSIKLALVD